MSLGVGQRLGPYEILGLLGAGGMGEVYRARDPRLGRDIAVKVLPSLFSADARRLHRFEQEARAAGMLNHPNLLAVHDVGTHDGSPYLVTELLDGETLRERLSSGPLPPHKVYDYAIQIAMGLAAAHEKGIVHRDLKPENVFLTRDGRIKILDFGLAKLTGSDEERETGSSVPTTPRDTDPGVAIGTVGYMSPEQVRGQTADARSDLFAVGAIVYEMISSKRAFRRETAVETMNAILVDDPPDIADASPPLSRLMRRCLEKKSGERFQSARDLAFALEALSGGSGSTTPALPDSVGKKMRARLGWMIAGLFALGTLALVLLSRREREFDSPAYQFEVLPPLNANLGASQSEGVAVSPDGHHLVFVATEYHGTTRLFHRTLDSIDARALPGTENASFPFWSPDSRFVGFTARGKLQKIDITGGPPQTLCDAGLDRGGTWNRAGVVLFAPDAGGPIYRVSASGGAAAPLTRLDASRQENAHRWPEFLPDGKHFLYVARSANPEHTGIYLRSLDSPETRRLIGAYSSVAYAANHLLFVRGETLMAQRFDASRLTLAGEPLPVVEGVGSLAAIAKGLFSVSQTGTLVYRERSSELVRPTWFDREGREFGNLGSPGYFGTLNLSPDEQLLAFDRLDPQTGSPDVWLFQLSRGVASRFTSHPAGDYYPVWSPDGSQIAFSSNRLPDSGTSLYRKASSGVGEEELLLRSSRVIFPVDWSSDGRFIIYEDTSPETNADLWALPLEGDRKPMALVQTRFAEVGGRLTPDGRWLAYTSDESGRPEIYIRPFQAPGGGRSISTSGGMHPEWSRDGTELFYLSMQRSIMSISFDSDDRTFRTGVPRELFNVPRIVTDEDIARPYVVSRDGQRFLMNTFLPEASAPIRVFVNWTPERKD